MSKYIDLDKIPFVVGFDAKTDEEIRLVTKKQLDDIPTADVVEVRHGKWLSAYEYALKIGATGELIENAKNDKRWKFCCHCEQPVKWDYNYCPTCGAKMDGRSEE